jgi:NAD(P)-dependent dehydrogenase (short-subunit alcohol dehydrogenase family)
MSKKLDGKIAVITGGGSGIGLAIAQRFVAEGAYVFITGRRQAELDRAVASIGDNIAAVQGDVTVTADLDRLYETVKAKSGRLDVLVVNSGIAEPAPLTEITEAHFDKLFDVNARASLFTVQKAVPLMTGGGTIVLVGSIAGSIGTAGYTAYGATKAAMRSYARSWTTEFGDRGIRVNTLSPGPIDTPMFDKVSDELKDMVGGLIPLRRMGRPEEVASAALFLASDESSYIAGAELCIDGGMSQV